VAMGHEVRLFSSKFPGAGETDSIGGVEVSRSGGRFTVYRSVRNLIRESGESPDLIVEQVNTVPFLIKDRPPSSRYGALIYQTCEEIWPHIAPWPASSLGRHILEPKWMRFFENVPTITLADSTKRDLQRMGLRNIKVVPPGRDSRSSVTAAKYETATVVHVGRLVSYKKVDELIAACDVLGKTVSGFRLLIVGDGPERARLEKNAPSYVHFLGRLEPNQRDEIVARSHLQVVTSTREGWGLIVTEAAELGTPTLAYDVSGTRDSAVLADGWICPPDVDAMRAWLPWALEKARVTVMPPDDTHGCLAWPEVARLTLNHWMS
jgi:glycosyltransferase involved in cell wall biosynthesis